MAKNTKTTNAQAEMNAAAALDAEFEQMLAGGKEEEPTKEAPRRLTEEDYANLPSATKTFERQTVFMVTVCDLHTGTGKAFEFSTWNDANRYYNVVIAKAKATATDEEPVFAFFDKAHKIVTIKKNRKVRVVAIGNGERINGLSSAVSRDDVKTLSEGRELEDY